MVTELLVTASSVSAKLNPHFRWVGADAQVSETHALSKLRVLDLSQNPISKGSSLQSCMFSPVLTRLVMDQCSISRLSRLDLTVLTGRFAAL